MQYTLPNAVVREQDLAGKLAIVTGASRGIGRGIAFHLASRGANILGTCSSESTLAKISSLQEEIFSLYKADNKATAPQIRGIVAPLLRPQEYVANIVAGVKQLGGKVNILVQNAAVVEVAPVDFITEDHVSRLLMANIEAPVFLVQGLLSHFQRGSRIVNISSEGGRDSQVVTLVYGSCKSALESMTRVWADALGKRPGMEETTVNSIAVGTVNVEDAVTNTDLGNSMPDNEYIRQFLEEKKRACSVGERLGEVDDISEIVGWLAGEKSRWVTGSVVSGNGGTVKIL